MFRQKLFRTLILVALVTVAAVAADYLLNVVIRSTPAAFTPRTTALIGLLVSFPVGFYLISQRLDMQRVKEALAASLADKDLAVVESHQRREEAEVALERLRKSEALYRLLADNQTDVVSLWSANGTRKYASPSVERTYGISVADTMNQPAWAGVHPDDLPMIKDLFATLAPADGPRNAEFRILNNGGPPVWVEGTFRRLADGSGDLLTTTRIVTERKRLGEELVRALDEANAALAVKAEFLANMTHELRTPLNAIIGFSGLLRQSAALNASDSHQVELVWDASQTLLRVVNDVLDFSKLEAGAVEFDAHPFDPRWVAESTVSLLAGQASSKGLTLSVHADGQGGLLLGDGGRLRQVLLNLVSNAVKFTARGDIEVLVSQADDGDQRRLRMAVKDSGIGIPADQFDTIFGRFTQGDASVSRQFGGTGLGLAICRLIVEAMGGRIGVDSAVGQGSTFWFEVSMPVAATNGAGEAPARPPARIDRALRLLLVDDNAVNRELISALLAPFDLIIETARDGVEAIAAQSRAHFDLILMDVQMPVMDGLTATRRIRGATPAGARRVPIVAMTANVLPEQVTRCLEAGMDDHIGKPIDPATLLATLARWSRADRPAEARDTPRARRAAR